MFQEDYSTEQHHCSENYHGDNLCVAVEYVNLFTESRKVYEVVLDRAINFELR